MSEDNEQRAQLMSNKINLVIESIGSVTLSGEEERKYLIATLHNTSMNIARFIPIHNEQFALKLSMWDLHYKTYVMGVYPRIDALRLTLEAAVSEYKLRL
jgi:hypothetical protein